MACCNSNENTCSCNVNNNQCGCSDNINYVIILVLYILLAIIIGSAFCW